MDSAAQLLEKGDVESLLRVLRMLPESPVLVVIDTLARAMGGGNENSAKDMGGLVRAADAIRTTLNTAVLLIHHPTKGDPFEPRGSSALEGAADFMMAVERLGTHLELRERKNKEYEPIGKLIAHLQPHEDSCIVECAEASFLSNQGI